MGFLCDIVVLDICVQNLDQEVQSVALNEFLLKTDGHNVVCSSAGPDPELWDVIVLVGEKGGLGVKYRV